MQLFSFVAAAGCLGLALGAAVPLEERTYNTCKYASPAYLKSVKRQFKTDGIVPDLIERINPTVEVDVSYGTKQVKLGTYFTTAQTINQPTFSITAEWGHNPLKSNYSLFMIDPDVPERGSPAQKYQETTVIYEPLTPLSTTQHRYTFLVFREPPGYEPGPTGTALLNIRTPFDINDYADDNGLILVGGNFLKEAIDNGIQG